MRSHREETQGHTGRLTLERRSSPARDSESAVFYRAGDERKLTGLENGFSGSQRGVRDHFEHEKE